jgi:hypothetical protein
MNGLSVITIARFLCAVLMRREGCCCRILSFCYFRGRKYGIPAAISINKDYEGVPEFVQF